MSEYARIKFMLDQCIEHLGDDCFTDWECDFIESVGVQFEERKSLSDKQSEALEKIWNKI